MEQLLCHLIGDYVLQTDTQALQKTKSWWYAFVHSFTYGLPFLLLTQSVLILSIISGTHLVIDHFRLARYFIIAKNLQDNSKDVFQGLYNTPTGFKEQAPAWLAAWVFIMVDNTLHLTINYAALRWLG